LFHYEPEVRQRVEADVIGATDLAVSRSGNGNPEAISDTLVDETVRLLPEFHEAWIKSFNLRCAKRPQT